MHILKPIFYIYKINYTIALSSYLSYESRICLWLYNIWYLIFQITYLRVLSSYVCFAIMYVSSFLPYRFIFIGEMSRSSHDISTICDQDWHTPERLIQITLFQWILILFCCLCSFIFLMICLFLYLTSHLYFVYELLCPSFCWYIYYFQSKGFILSFSLSVLWVFFPLWHFHFS